MFWPGGVRNRLYDVEHGNQVTLPEIPCSFAADWPSEASYRACVELALDDLTKASVITEVMRQRFLDSAIRSFNDNQR